MMSILSNFGTEVITDCVAEAIEIKNQMDESQGPVSEVHKVTYGDIDKKAYDDGNIIPREVGLTHPSEFCTQ